MKKRSSIILLLLCSALLIFSISCRRQQADDEIVIGLVVATTGRFAAAEAGIHSGTRMAIDGINAAGGVNGKRLVLVHEDTGSEQAGAVNAFNRVVTRNPVFIINTALSSFFLAMMPDIERARIPTSPMGENPVPTQQGNPWVLRFNYSDLVTPIAALRFAQEELGANNIAIIRANTEFGQHWENTIVQELALAGQRPATIEVFQTDDRDMTAQLNRIRTSGADAMIAIGDPPNHAILLVQRRQLGLGHIHYVGSSTVVQPQTIDMMEAEEIEGVFSLTGAVPAQDPNPAVREWNARHREIFGVDADHVAANAYDAVHIIADGIRAVGQDRAALRDWILAVQGREGMGNIWSFSPNGDGGTRLSIVEVRDRVPHIIATQTVN